ncbi:hypothetical protein CROQUDRAFT_522928 [Cronartium quercuum f. sp. fusiforme G11]|uniref:Opi1-domain-containing protein n=1 Tax=Cronartium quercuum f. sp. fusiforme G11 TaxID=708437 RepID=A0A9P6NHY4_9BASI|nr:hypothetical protein CROQUDRAFT_522928 [Cronartium quercuum f. sp. fusiforme G11]
MFKPSSGSDSNAHSHSTSFLRNCSAEASENETEVDDKASSIDTDHDPDEPTPHSRHSVINEEDEDVKMAISALSVMKTGGPSRPTFDFCPPGYLPIYQDHHYRNAYPTRNKPAEDIPRSAGPPQNPPPDLPSHSRPTSIHQNDPHLNPTTLPGLHQSSLPRPRPPPPHPPPDRFYLDAYGKPVDAHGHPVDVVQVEDPEGGIFLQRVGRMPLVSGVVRAYERGKGTSRVVKYGADLVESSVTSISGRVVSKVGPERIAQIDRYAGAALERLGQISGIQPQRESSTAHVDSHPYAADPFEQLGYASDYRSSLRRRNMTITPSSHLPCPAEADMDRGGSQSPVRHRTGQEVAGHTGNESDLETPAASPGGRLVQVASSGRSRWQSMLVEAGMTAGGIGAAVSEESMKSLKYCLHWLQYATAHLDHQITVLRDFIGSLTISGRSSQALISPRAVETLDRIKKEIVETIRKVVDVVSKYAGGALPEQAKQFVRKSILSLPIKWASTIQAEHTLNPRLTYGFESGTGSQPDGSTARGTTEIAADRILSFAVEGLDMLKSVAATFSESVDRADAWVERLRVIGIQHRQQRAEDEAEQEREPRSERGPVSARPTRKRAESGELEPVGKGSFNSLATVRTSFSSAASSRDNTFRRARVGTGLRSRDSSTSTSWGSSSAGAEQQSACSVNTTITSSASEQHHPHTFPDRLAVKRRRANDGLATVAYTTCSSNPAAPTLEHPAPEEDRVEERSSSTLKHLLNQHNVDNHEEWDGWSEN